MSTGWMEKLEHRQVQTNGIGLHVVQAGPADRPLVILLHGFPEFWYGWRHQIPYLAGAGYRVWAPDQRGYNLSDKPKGIAAYRSDDLAADVIGLIDAAGRDKAFLVGHDWGAAVAWWTAARYAERIERMVIMNAPHWRVMREHLERNPAQWLKSWYILFFQIPWLPEALGRLGNRHPAAFGRGGAGMYTNADPELYRKAWLQPNALTSMINWYRASARKPSPPPPTPRISVPTLLIWGSRDAYLVREMAQPSIDLCDDGRLVFFENATHWVQHEEPAGVNRLIDDFLRPGPKV
jgi:pimeloyl-ACP methyl ester carboxylesterase